MILVRKAYSLSGSKSLRADPLHDGGLNEATRSVCGAAPEGDEFLRIN